MLDKDNQMQDYASFLESKFKFSKSYGFEIDKKSINPMLKPHQTEIVHWAVAKGRAVELNPAYYADGLRHIHAMESEVLMPSLFAMEDIA